MAKNNQQRNDPGVHLISFTALPGLDEVYFLDKKTKLSFGRKFKFDLVEYPGDIDEVYDWVKKKAVFVGYTICVT